MNQRAKSVDIRTFRTVLSFCANAVLLSTVFLGAAGYGTEPPITALTIAPDGKSIVAVSQSGLLEFSWPNLKLQRAIKASAANLHTIAFSPSGKQLAVGGGNPSEEGIVEIFSWPAAKSKQVIVEHEDSVTSISWRDESHFFSASLDRTIKLCDLENGDSTRSFQGHSRGVSGLCVVRQSELLVSVGDDQSVRVWNPSTSELIRSLSQHTKPIRAAALRPSDEGLPIVASAAGDRTIRFWQPTIGRMVRYVRLESEPLGIAWLPGSSRIAAACVDGRVRVVDADIVKVIQTSPAISGWAYAIAAHPSGNSLVVGGSDGQIRRVELESEIP